MQPHCPVRINAGKEGNILFNNKLNIFLIRLYGVRVMGRHRAVASFLEGFEWEMLFKE